MPEDPSIALTADQIYHVGLLSGQSCAIPMARAASPIVYVRMKLLHRKTLAILLSQYAPEERESYYHQYQAGFEAGCAPCIAEWPSVEEVLSSHI